LQQYIFQNRTANLNQKDLFPDPTHFVPPSPPLHFRALPEPPTVGQGHRETADKYANNFVKEEELNRQAETHKEKESVEIKYRKELEKETNSSKYIQKEKKKILKTVEKLRDEIESKKTLPRNENDDFCEKCHHKKGRRRKRNVKKNDFEVKHIDDSDLSHKRKREEKEILRGFTKESPNVDYFCDCSNHGFYKRTLKPEKVRQPSNSTKNFTFT
jgi:hypothetical protein